MSISVEVLDCAFGCAAEGVWVSLLRKVDSGWRHQASDRTDAAGTVATLEPAPGCGRYRLVVDLDQYYPALGTEPSVSQVELIFRVFRPGERVRILVTISPSSCQAIRRGNWPDVG